MWIKHDINIIYVEIEQYVRDRWGDWEEEREKIETSCWLFTNTNNHVGDGANIRMLLPSQQHLKTYNI